MFFVSFSERVFLTDHPAFAGWPVRDLDSVKVSSTANVKQCSVVVSGSVVEILRSTNPMGSLDGTHFMQLTGKQLPVYPSMRVAHTLEQWYNQVLVVLSRYGLVHVRKLFGDLEDMNEKYQIIVNKLYGTLLAPDGPFCEDHFLYCSKPSMNVPKMTN